MGVFNFYSPGRGYERTLVMVGDFTGDDLFEMNQVLLKEGIIYG